MRFRCVRKCRSMSTHSFMGVSTCNFYFDDPKFLRTLLVLDNGDYWVSFWHRKLVNLNIKVELEALNKQIWCTMIWEQSTFSTNQIHLVWIIVLRFFLQYLYHEHVQGTSTIILPYMVWSHLRGLSMWINLVKLL